ncbi:hypothetical protein [Candidatus Bathycorpusculum sp.]|uniref:hypothetical protein n=1 Tax=Candidatus Bathycorpusculum sp. TaxID=2994959 RepID=UPI00283716D1|nr:hypothetical protein [Candidatus Termitimicrobium sp.]MCL2432069.1 hypothetical protein [Candidatus Termitimicrobium sp.]
MTEKKSIKQAIVDSVLFSIDRQEQADQTLLDAHTKAIAEFAEKKHHALTIMRHAFQTLLEHTLSQTETLAELQEFQIKCQQISAEFNATHRVLVAQLDTDRAVAKEQYHKTIHTLRTAAVEMYLVSVDQPLEAA